MPVEVLENALENALRTVAVNGSYHASRSLSKWFHRGVRLTSDGFQAVPVVEATSVLGLSDDVIAAIHLPLTGDLTGHMLLMFPDDVGVQLADMMMQNEPGTTTTITDLEQSCLEETGNIVCSAYANSLAKWLQLSIEPGAPLFAYDMGSAIIESVVGQIVVNSDEVLVASTDFMIDGKSMQWPMLFILSTESWEKVQTQCKIEQVREQALRTIAVNVAFSASRSMSKWVKKGVKISTEGFVKVPLTELENELPSDEPVAAMHMPLGSNVHGHVLLVLGETHARKLCGLLMGDPDNPPLQLEELEISALQETANIISSSFVNSWSTWLEMQFETGPPIYVFDHSSAVIESVIADQVVISDSVFLARTDFMLDDTWLEMTLILLPSPTAMRLIETACK